MIGSRLLLLLVLQLLEGGGPQWTDQRDSLDSGSCDISSDVMATSDEVISDEVISHEVMDADVQSAVTAERRRELWRTAHGMRNNDTDVHCGTGILSTIPIQTSPTCLNWCVWRFQPLDSSAPDSRSESLAPPTLSTAPELDTPHYSFSQSGERERRVFFFSSLRNKSARE